MNIENVDIEDLQKKLNYKKDDITKKLDIFLHKLIYPIIIPENLIGTKDIILNFKDTEKKRDDNFQIPNNLFINKICNDKTKNEIINLLNNYFMKYVGEKFFRRKNLFESRKKFGLIGLKEIFRKDLRIYSVLKKIIINLYKNLYSNYDTDYMIKNILNKSKITLLYYSHNKLNTFEGLAHHIDSFSEHDGAISVISFDHSVIDFIPFVELKDEDAFRVLIPDNYAITFDGNLRYYYTHGVPSNIKYTNNFRYALNIRHPAINNDFNNENCNLYNSFAKDTNIFKCKSSISIKPLKF